MHHNPLLYCLDYLHFITIIVNNSMFLIIILYDHPLCFLCTCMYTESVTAPCRLVMKSFLLTIMSILTMILFDTFQLVRIAFTFHGLWNTNNIWSPMHSQCVPVEYKQKPTTMMIAATCNIWAHCETSTPAWPCCQSIISIKVSV